MSDFHSDMTIPEVNRKFYYLFAYDRFDELKAALEDGYLCNYATYLILGGLYEDNKNEMFIMLKDYFE
ncbi:Hypothetical protein HVR_LOCUS337 [uncultured virus]|nr:Hypothetical protein HVR_LOCUS337 [uncultured virus]